MYTYYYETLSMIPDQKNYLVIDETNDVPIGILDEAFVAEYGDPGVKFIVRGSSWRINSVYGDKIYVQPVSDPKGSVPSWVGEEIPVPFNIAREVGEIRGIVEAQLQMNDSLTATALILSEKYPAEVDTISRAISETVEQIQRGLMVPTDLRITLEEWDQGVIINASFGSLVNRALALLIGHLLSEKAGYTVGVQSDPYRVIVKAQGSITPQDVKDIVLKLNKMNLEAVAIEAVIKGRLFKRRMIHVARKCGAVSKYADLSTISLNQLMKSFQGSAIYDEAVRVAISRDMDLENLTKVLGELGTGTVGIVILDTNNDLSPIARLGLEKIGKRVSLISPEKLRNLSIESARVRLLNEIKTFVCTSCWSFVQMSPIKNIPDRFACPRCGSYRLGVTNKSDVEVSRIIEKLDKRLTSQEKWVIDQTRETGKLMAEYGRLAALTLAGKNLSISNIKEILSKEKLIGNQLFELIIEAERKALIKKFW
jgi:ATP-dependent Lhr-like helicase